MPAPGFALQTVLGEMSVLVLEGQRAVPAKLQALGFQFKYPTIEPALRQLLAKPAEAAPTAAPAGQPPAAPSAAQPGPQPETPEQQPEKAGV